MGITGSLIIYVCLWWIVFFSVLPIGIVSSSEKYQERLKGNDQGAPKNPQIGMKFILTTLITTLIFIGIYYIVTNNYFNLREYLQ